MINKKVLDFVEGFPYLPDFGEEELTREERFENMESEYTTDGRLPAKFFVRTTNGEEVNRILSGETVSLVGWFSENPITPVFGLVNYQLDSGSGVRFIAIDMEKLADEGTARAFYSDPGGPGVYPQLEGVIPSDTIQVYRFLDLPKEDQQEIVKELKQQLKVPYTKDTEVPGRADLHNDNTFEDWMKELMYK